VPAIEVLPNTKVLLRFMHGLGDAVQLTVVLRLSSLPKYWRPNGKK
jgi:hypothetical protein